MNEGMSECEEKSHTKREREGKKGDIILLL